MSVVLILGSGPNVALAQTWDRGHFDQIVVMNNAWRVRPDWDALVFPEDFDPARLPHVRSQTQRYVEADAFVSAQNRSGGFVMAGATMAYTSAYWALDALRPSVMAFMGCDMVYPKSGPTHFYGTGTPDPLRGDVSLRDLGAKSARLALIAAAQGCACVNLSRDPSALVFERAEPQTLRDMMPMTVDMPSIAAIRAREDALGYATPDGRYDASGAMFDLGALDGLDADWRALFARQPGTRQGEVLLSIEGGTYDTSNHAQGPHTGDT